MLTRIPAERQNLYDGMEPELWTTRWALPVGGASVTLAEIDENDLDLLSARIGDEAFDQVVADGGFVRTDFGSYRATDGSQLLYVLHEDCLFVLGVQEFQPARYLVMFEAAWKIS